MTSLEACSRKGRGGDGTGGMADARPTPHKMRITDRLRGSPRPARNELKVVTAGIHGHGAQPAPHPCGRLPQPAHVHPGALMCWRRGRVPGAPRWSMSKGGSAAKRGKPAEGGGGGAQNTELRTHCHLRADPDQGQCPHQSIQGSEEGVARSRGPRGRSDGRPPTGRGGFLFGVDIKTVHGDGPPGSEVPKGVPAPEPQIRPSYSTCEEEQPAS